MFSTNALADAKKVGTTACIKRASFSATLSASTTRPSIIRLVFSKTLLLIVTQLLQRRRNRVRPSHTSPTVLLGNINARKTFLPNSVTARINAGVIAEAIAIVAVATKPKIRNTLFRFVNKALVPHRPLRIMTKRVPRKPRSFCLLSTIMTRSAYRPILTTSLRSFDA